MGVSETQHLLDEMSQDNRLFAQVVVAVPVRGAFTYQVPSAVLQKVRVGQRVLVSFRGRLQTGVIVELSTQPDEKLVSAGTKLQKILDVLEEVPSLPEPLVHLLDWIARYYFAPPGEVLRLMLPKPLRKKTQRAYRTTEFGTKCLAEGLLSEKHRFDVLKFLKPSTRPVPESRIRSNVKGLTYLKLSEMAEKGLIEERLPPENPNRGRRVVKMLSRVGDPEAKERLGAKQQAVLDFLEGRGAVLEREVRDYTEASLTTIRSMIRRGWVEQSVEERYRDPFATESIPPQPDIVLTEEQTAAIAGSVGDGTFSSPRNIVLHGVTGSGKTQVYLAAMKAAADVGRRGLLLLPEIALTPQLVGIFRGTFGQRVAVLHSALTEGERFDEWRRIRRGEVDVVIGARSAIFAPLEKLGVIVVDEEHDSSFKQDSGVRYHARDLALVRGKREKALVILGSATPSLETSALAKTGRAQRLKLTTRPTGQPLPSVEIVDMREVPKNKSGRRPLLSPRLRDALIANHDKRQQAILFLNRRGHSPSVVCPSCGHDFRCPHCEITLTYHRAGDELKCHYCDYREPLATVCPTCANTEWMFLGAGTQKLSDQIVQELGDLRTTRLDRDTASSRGIRKILKEFREGDSDVLVGTQMVTKGHDFPNVTLVGVVNADISLRVPDFRSGERTFQLLSQVAGRAGRREIEGRVIIQTYLPDHPAVRAAITHDYDSFSQNELECRQQLRYPPFGYLIVLHFEGNDLNAVRTVTDRYQQSAQRIKAGLVGEVYILGPVEAPLGRLKGKFRWQMLVRSHSRSLVRSAVGRILDAAGYGKERTEGVSVIVDVDPFNLM